MNMGWDSEDAHQPSERCGTLVKRDAVKATRANVCHRLMSCFAQTPSLLVPVD